MRHPGIWLILTACLSANRLMTGVWQYDILGTLNFRMTLKQYAFIVWKRAWVPVVLVAVVAIASFVSLQTPSATYSTSMRFTVGVQPQNLPNEFTFDSYYAWLSSEYLVDDMDGVGWQPGLCR